MADLIQDVQNTRQCPICSEVVVNKKLHINMHYGMNGNHHCKHCRQIFADEDNLRMHECVHTVIQDESVLTSLHPKRRMYQCPFCPKTFQFSSRCMEHVAVHSKERRYTCLYCPKTFKNVYSVWDHLVNNHSKLTDPTQVNKRNVTKSEIKSSLKQKATQTMKVTGCHREIKYRLPASMKNVNLYPRVVLSLALTKALSKV